MSAMVVVGMFNPQSKDKRIKDDAYLKWVRQQDCVVSGEPNSSPHHIISCGLGGGTSTKVDDYLTFPLSFYFHSALSPEGLHKDVREWHKRHGHQARYVIKTLHRAFEEGAINEETCRKYKDICEELLLKFDR